MAHLLSVPQENYPLSIVVDELDIAKFEGGEYMFVYKVPLTNQAAFLHNLPSTVTARDLMNIAVGDYRRIYAEEEATSVVQAEDSQQVNMGGKTITLMNRTKTQGKYGIWGHVLGDLFFEVIKIDTEKKTIDFLMGT
jgi:RNA-binding protein YhbY